MKYIVVLIDSDGMTAKKCIEATKLTTDDTFVIFQNRTKLCMLAKDAILSISTEDYVPGDVVDKPVSREARNAKLIELYKKGTT